MTRRIFRFSRTCFNVGSCGIRGFLAALLAVSGTVAFAQGGAVKAAANYGKIPLGFETNRGQTDPSVQFVSRGSGYALFLTRGEAVLKLERSQAAKGTRSATLRMALTGANMQAIATAQEPQAGTVNYFHGNDPSKWVANVPTYGRVNYASVYPGIDLTYYGNQRQLEYDFVVAPSANPAKIALRFTGATPHIDAAGDLILSGKGHQTSFRAPVAYQLAGNDRVPVTSAYALKGGQVTFTLGVYDHSKALVIDPVLTYATFLGGSMLDEGLGIASDAAGNTYIGGDSESYDFPVLNAIKSTNTGKSNGYNIFVTKLNPAGTAILYSTYLGGIYDTSGGNIAVDAAGSVYVVGVTSSGDYPVTAGAFQTICGANFSNTNGVHSRANGCSPSSGNTSGVLTKLSPAGNSLVYSTFFGGDYYNAIIAVAVDAAGEAYVTGNTNASCSAGPYYPNGEDSWDCFPTTSGALQAEINGAFKAGSGSVFGFFTKFTSDGSGLVYSTLFAAPIGSAPSGGAIQNTANAIAVDASGNAYIVGNGGYGLPTTAGAFFVPPVNSSQVLPPFPAYIAKFDPTKSGSASLVYSTFLGSSAQTANYSSTATGVAIDASGDAIVAGYTNACGYPTTTGAYEPTTGSSPVCQDGFITKLNPTGTGLVWSTLYGTSPTVTNNQGTTQIFGMTQGASGNIYVTGSFTVGSGGNALPFVNPIEKVVNGGAFVAEFDPTGSKLLFASPLSGYYGADQGTAVTVDPSGNIYLTGRVAAATPTTPITAGAFQQKYGGGAYDAYVVKIAPLFNSTTAVALSASTATAGAPVTFTATVAAVGSTTAPTGTVTFLNGATSLGTGTIGTGGTAAFTTSSLAVGTYAITAQYGGDTNFNPSSTATAQALTVGINGTSTTLATSASTAPTGTSITFTATVAPASGTITPTGTVTFKDGTTVLGTGTLSGGKTAYTTATLAVGSHSIAASYGGDSNDAASVSAATAVTITVPPPDFSIAFSASSGTIAAGSSSTITITETPGNGFVASTSFACNGLPAFATCTFSPASLTPASGTPVTTTLTIATNVAMATLKVPALPFSNRLPLAPVMAGLLLLPLVALRRRKMPRLALAILAGMLMLAPTGCGSSLGTSQSVTPKGAYPVTVTATAGTTSHTQVYTITVQ
jgi:hypothetical protein